MNAKIIWEELYSDLSPRSAKALRDARVKPGQLTIMSDGEITALPGVGEVALEQIRTLYPVDLSEEPKVEEKETTEEVVEEKPKSTRREDFPPNKRHLFRNSAKHKESLSKVDGKKLYSIEEAVSLLKVVNTANFNASVTLHLNLFERLPRVEVTFPHSTGKVKKIAIVTDDLLAEIEKGNIDFDILIAEPSIMSKLAKHAKILGPRGLMPNPKAGTVTDKPEDKKKELEGGKTLVKCEPKFPLMHITLGKIEMKEAELITNIQAAIKAVNPSKIEKATLSSSMSPGIKLLIE